MINILTIFFVKQQKLFRTYCYLKLFQLFHFFLLILNLILRQAIKISNFVFVYMTKYECDGSIALHIKFSLLLHEIETNVSNFLTRFRHNTTYCHQEAFWSKSILRLLRHKYCASHNFKCFPLHNRQHPKKHTI